MFTICVKLLFILNVVESFSCVIEVWITHTLTAVDLVTEFVLCKRRYKESFCLHYFVYYVKTLLFSTASDVTNGLQSFGYSELYDLLI